VLPKNREDYSWSSCVEKRTKEVGQSGKRAVLGFKISRQIGSLISGEALLHVLARASLGIGCFSGAVKGRAGISMPYSSQGKPRRHGEKWADSLHAHDGRRVSLLTLVGVEE
jgi:hypothetical protein